MEAHSTATDDAEPTGDHTATDAARRDGGDGLPTDARDLARRVTIGVLVAVVALLGIRGGVGLVGVELGGGEMSPFAVVPMLLSTVVAGVGAAVAYAVLVRVTDSPARYFLGLAAVVFAVMLVPVAVVVPSLGVTLAGQAVLVGFHVAVAVPLVAFVLGYVGR